jgi:hypothetical protein
MGKEKLAVTAAEIWPKGRSERYAVVLRLSSDGQSLAEAF